MELVLELFTTVTEGVGARGVAAAVSTFRTTRARPATSLR